MESLWSLGCGLKGDNGSSLSWSSVCPSRPYFWLAISQSTNLSLSRTRTLEAKSQCQAFLSTFIITCVSCSDWKPLPQQHLPSLDFSIAWMIFFQILTVCVCEGPAMFHGDPLQHAASSLLPPPFSFSF